MGEDVISRQENSTIGVVSRKRNQEPAHADRKKKILVSPPSNAKLPTSCLKRNETGKESNDTNSETVVPKDKSGRNSAKSVSSTSMTTRLNSTLTKEVQDARYCPGVSGPRPERTSSRIRKRSSKYADYEDVPTFSRKRHDKSGDECEREKYVDWNKVSPVKGRKRKVQFDQDHEESSHVVSTIEQEMLDENLKEKEEVQNPRISESLTEQSNITGNKLKENTNQENEIAITIMLESNLDGDETKKADEQIW